MFPTTRGLFLSVFFLLGLEDTVFSQHVSCVRNKCFAFFSERRDFPGALGRCGDSGGQLLKFSSANEAQLIGLVGTRSGAYWLEVAGSGAGTEKTLSQNCSSIFVSMCRNLGVRQGLCSQKLDGFLCEYTYSGMCKSLQTGSGAQVSYNSTRLFSEIVGSDYFPEGTLAVEERVGSKFPDSRYVCLDGSWIPAPWTCEVLGGGCDYKCSHTCICPPGQSLHPNSISCTTDPCAHCAHECNKDGDTPVCTCREGFRLAPDLKTCEEVPELTEDMNPCSGESMEWDGSKCKCRDNLYEEDGMCVDFSICPMCEQKCVPDNGVARCACREGFRVSAHDSTKCVPHCSVRQCPAHCIPSEDGKTDGCRCPDGYIRESVNGTAYCTDMDECDSGQCDQKCLNTFGSFSCLCERGFRLHNGYRCVRVEGEEEEEDSGSGESPSVPTPEAHPASGQALIKTGSVLGVAVIVALFAVMLFFLVRHLLSRCGKFQLSSLKHHDIDIFYLQQMTTGTYQRFSSDRPWKNDPEVI
ncbi:thrombomodulin-like [Halichoeres trimaculatus]|uniref:thrombomodulin-like n=1 Tax=Halichoeres trimaculatus TaxID=147232 RepID=UPI003D9EFF0A